MGQLVLDPQYGRARVAKVQGALAELGIHALLLPVSGELKWLIGYDAHALERLTMFVVKGSGVPVLVAPELEVNMLKVPPDLFRIRKWSQGDNPFQMVVDEVGNHDGSIIVGGKDMALKHSLPLQRLTARASWLVSGADTDLLTKFRRCKDQAEMEALRNVALAVDSVIREIQTGFIQFVGRTERQVAEDVKLLMKGHGHEEVNFVIVAAGKNAADPHHEPDDTVIERDQIILFDIGGKLKGYCSDITRCLYLGKKIPDDIQRAYDVLARAQQLAHEAIRAGRPAKEIDAAARDCLTQHGYGDMFIHSLGHGLGLDPQEDPFLTKVNESPVQEGDVFSNEPGIYHPEAGWGMRLEDIEAVIGGQAVRLNGANRNLICLDV